MSKLDTFLANLILVTLGILSAVRHVFITATGNIGCAEITRFLRHVAFTEPPVIKGEPGRRSIGRENYNARRDSFVHDTKELQTRLHALGAHGVYTRRDRNKLLRGCITLAHNFVSEHGSFLLFHHTYLFREYYVVALILFTITRKRSGEKMF